ncbi:MAG TPA: hypothetical protein VM366_00105 [Anaerolineae bacterium]|nr:hypothetical protein [Anaerolineae bacterium]
MSDWSEMQEQRDADGNLTDLALALDAIGDIGYATAAVQMVGG